MASKALASKIVLITGGASGLGKAIASACLSEGASVAVGDISDKGLQQCEADVGSKGPFLTVKLDVSSEESATKAIEAVVQKFHRLDVLINCAGILDGFFPVDDLDMALWNKVMAVNLTGPFVMSKLAVQQFLSQSPPSGNIVNIGSVASLRGVAGGAAYTASKHALVGLTKHTAASYCKQGIRCNIVYPGGMDTNLARPFMEVVQAKANGTANGGSNGAGINSVSYSESGWENIGNITAMGVQHTIVDVNDVANTVIHLASDASKAVNGAGITVDNGWTAY